MSNQFKVAEEASSTSGECSGVEGGEAEEEFTSKPRSVDSVVILKSSIHHTEDEGTRQLYEHMEMRRLGLPTEFGQRQKRERMKKKRQKRQRAARRREFLSSAQDQNWPRSTQEESNPQANPSPTSSHGHHRSSSGTWHVSSLSTDGTALTTTTSTTATSNEDNYYADDADIDDLVQEMPTLVLRDSPYDHVATSNPETPTKAMKGTSYGNSFPAEDGVCMQVTTAPSASDPEDADDHGVMLEHSPTMPVKGTAKVDTTTTTTTTTINNTDSTFYYSMPEESMSSEMEMEMDESMELNNNHLEPEEGVDMGEEVDEEEETAPKELEWRAAARRKTTSKSKSRRLKSQMNVYWHQRHILFSRFNEGIRLDKESWYSVTPEPIARHIAYRIEDAWARYRPREKFVILDGFCGAGGNVIQFALLDSVVQVYAIDIDPRKIEMARHNAAIYECEHKIQFIVGDFFEVLRSHRLRGVVDVCFYSSPWGGPDYRRISRYSLNHMEPNGFDIVRHTARHLTTNIAMLLPRNYDPAELVLVKDAIYKSAPEAAGDRKVELERNMIFSKVKTMCAYFGELVNEVNAEQVEVVYEHHRG